MRTEEDADVAALITADADATMAADVITDVDVTVDGDFQAEIIPAVNVLIVNDFLPNTLRTNNSKMESIIKFSKKNKSMYNS